MGGNFRPECPATLNRNGWQLSAGFSTIRRSIEENKKYYSASSKSTVELQDVFLRITEQISDVEKTLSETIESVEGLQRGTDKIIYSMKHLQSSNDGVRNALDAMEIDIDQGNESVEKIKTSVEHTRENIGPLMEQGKIIVRESSEVKEIGSENIENVKNLTLSLKKLHMEE